MSRFLVILYILICFACSENSINPENCIPDNPLNMNWMKGWVSDLQVCACSISIFQAEYNGDHVFWQLITDPLCQVTIDSITVFNCNGDELLVIENIDELYEFQNQVQDLKIIFQCETK